MIYSQATGGFGNQLYNYAIGFTLAQKYHDDFTLDISPYAFSPRPYVLNQLKITGKVCSLYPPKKNTKLFRMLARMQRIFATNRQGKCKWMKELPETRNQYGNYDFSYKKNLYLEGYWQHYKYFDECRELLCKEFTLKEEFCSPLYNELIQKCLNENSVAVHIRRGDYEASWILPDSYYHQAFQTIEYKEENLKYYIFCEDVAYVQEHYSYLQNAEFITGKYELSDLEEFFVMANCKHQIIANSTFSWWAAYLNTNAEKTVIAPEYRQWTKEYYPTNWRLIK